MCQEGCQCDDGFLFDGGECKTLDSCGCHADGKFYKVRIYPVCSFDFIFIYLLLIALKHDTNDTNHRRKKKQWDFIFPSKKINNFINIFCSLVRQSFWESVKKSASAKLECSPVNPWNVMKIRSVAKKMVPLGATTKVFIFIIRVP